MILGALWLKKFEPVLDFIGSRLKSLKSPFKHKKLLKLILLIFRSFDGVGVRSLFPFPSGNQKVLDFINKGITLDQIKNTFKFSKEAKLETIAFFMVGNLSETTKTIDETIRFSIELDPDFAQFTIATPYPGTKMYELIKKEGKLLFDNWDELASYGGTAFFEYLDLTPQLVQRKYKEAYLCFYLRPRYVLKRLIKIFSRREFINLIKGIRIFLRMISVKR